MNVFANFSQIHYFKTNLEVGDYKSFTFFFSFSDEYIIIELP